MVTTIWDDDAELNLTGAMYDSPIMIYDESTIYDASSTLNKNFIDDFNIHE